MRHRGRQAEVCRYALNECSSDCRQELGRLQQHYDLYFVRPRPMGGPFLAPAFVAVSQTQANLP